MMEWGLPLLWKAFNRGRFLYVPHNGNPHIAPLTHSKPRANYLRFVCLSDLHGKYDRLQVPNGDLLIVSGDLLDVESPIPQITQLRSFNTWLGHLPHEHKIVIAGNHDKCCEELQKEEVQKILHNSIYLQDSIANVKGLKIYGSPYSIIGDSDNRAFQHPRGAEELKRTWEKIPSGLDVLITHTPPKGFHDEGEGCQHLIEAVMEKKPLYHIFGHYHTEHGVSVYYHENMRKTTFINACSLSEGYYPIQRAIVFDMEHTREESALHIAPS